MRMLKHLFAPSASGTFPADSLKRIHDAIAEDELRHRGEICFAVESALHWRDVWNRVDSRQRAEDAFARLRVWDTAANSGVLVYLLLADHRIEIIADRGLRDEVSPEQWRGICQLMEERMKAGEPEDAVMRGVAEIGNLLARVFPQIDGQADADELSNAPVLLR